MLPARVTLLLTGKQLLVQISEMFTYMRHLLYTNLLFDATESIYLQPGKSSILDCNSKGNATSQSCEVGR